MSSLIQLGYEEKDSWVHKLDPRTKFILFIWASIFNYVFYDIYISLAFLIALIVLTVVGKVAKRILKIISIVLVPFYVLSTLVIALPIGFPYNETPLFSFTIFGFEITFYLEGAAYVAIWTLRLAITMISALLFFLTSNPARITTILLKLRIPYKYIYALLSVFQLIPIMQRRIQVIYQAQVSRGLNVNVGLFKRLKNFLAILIPLTLGSMSDLQLRSIALESRGFSAPVKKTFIIKSDLTKSDYVVLSVMLVFSALFIYWIMTVGLIVFMKGIPYIRPAG
ncbi:MAG: energy-coupling factor transporter transmembrane component T family protein [Candidatus Baldrarchaeia archaeon]